MKLKEKKLHPSAQPPVYATPGSACFDLVAVTVNGAHTLGSNVYEGHPATCGTGLAFEIPEGWCMMVYSRSGHGFKHSVRLANGTGIIDSDYRGELFVKLTCDEDAPEDQPPFFVRPGDRIAQAMLVPVERVEIELVDSLIDTQRGAGGFGSTG